MFVRCDALANLALLRGFSMRRLVAFVTQTKAALDIVDEFFFCQFVHCFGMSEHLMNQCGHDHNFCLQ